MVSYELLTRRDPQRRGWAWLFLTTLLIFSRWSGPVGRALSVASPTRALGRCRTPSPECSVAGGLSTGWAGGYCVPPKVDKWGTTGRSPCARLTGAGRVRAALGKSYHFPYKSGWKRASFGGGTKGVGGGWLLATSMGTWDGDSGLKRDRRGLCPKDRGRWGGWRRALEDGTGGWGCPGSSCMGQCPHVQ